LPDTGSLDAESGDTVAPLDAKRPPAGPLPLESPAGPTAAPLSPQTDAMNAPWGFMDESWPGPRGRTTWPGPSEAFRPPDPGSGRLHQDGGFLCRGPGLGHLGGGGGWNPVATRATRFSPSGWKPIN